MKKIFLISFLLFSINLSAQERKIDFVNPFIGTTNFGATNPGAVAPEGMISVVPYNVAPYQSNKIQTDKGWCSTPYVHTNNIFTGFSHVNMSGVGCPEAGSILLMPTNGNLEVSYKKYGSKIINKKASPGFFSCDIERYGIKAEVAASKRSSISRFIFPKGQSNILVNLEHGLTNESGAMLRFVSDKEIEGYKLLGTFCYNSQAVFPIYFVARFSKAPSKKGYWKKQPKLPGLRGEWSKTSGKYKLYNNYIKDIAGDGIGAYYTFDTKENEAIEVSVGISYVSIENARLNLETELKGKNQEQLKKETEDEWEQKMQAFTAEGSKEHKSMFYTALYHTLIHPNIINDVNGEYPAMGTQQTMKTEGKRYTLFSLWDTYRCFHQIKTLAYPADQLEMINSMLQMYDESGWLPKWEFASKEFHVMEGDPALAVIADTYIKGLTDFDTDKAYRAMIKSATTEGKNNLIRPDNDFYSANGYVPFTIEFDNSVSQAVEYYIADWSLASMAEKLGKKEDAEMLFKRVEGYKKYFDKKHKLMRPLKEDGNFLSPFNPKMGMNFEPSHGFHEGTSWNYSFSLPFDIEGLIKITGGKKKFVEKIEKCFSDSLFDMGNEPDIFYPYLFNYVKGEEWRTQKQVRYCINKYFNTTTSGIPGNDDAGTMSAWLMFSMMGIYPTCPAKTDYTLTSPVLDKLVINLDNKYYKGKKFVIETRNKSDKNIYIDKVELNGKPLKKMFITHKDIVKGGKLVFFLTDK